jgi:hypothetical protein
MADQEWIHCNLCFETSQSILKFVGECGCIFCSSCLKDDSCCHKCGKAKFLPLESGNIHPSVENILHSVESRLSDIIVLHQFQHGNVIYF